MSKILVVVGAAGLIGLAAAGCTGSTPAPSPAQTSRSVGPTSSIAAPPTTDIAAPPAAGSTPTSATPVAVRTLKFPNTSTTVLFTGYDTKNRMPEFQKVVQNPKVPYADLIPDPKDPAIHELPVAPGATVTSIDPDGFPFETCSPRHCTPDDVIQNVISHATLFAIIHVNATDQIDAADEIAY